MFSNSFIMRGPEAYNEQIKFLSGLPYVLWLEVLFIYLPILYHTFYGFYVMFTGRNNLSSYPYTANALYVLQRITGIITFCFVLYHVYETRIENLLYGTEVSFARMQHLLHEPHAFTVYLIGMTAVMFHFANGLWGFLISWGITVGERARRAAGYACVVIGLVLFAVGVNALIVLVR